METLPLDFYDKTLQKTCGDCGEVVLESPNYANRMALVRWLEMLSLPEVEIKMKTNIVLADGVK